MPIRVRHLNCGTFCPVGRLLINGHGSPLESGRLVCLCQLVETDQGLILVDTGLGTKDVKNPSGTLPGWVWQTLNRAQLRQEETAIYQMRAMGYRPEDVRHIVLTHLDFDHAGGLVDFPHAQVHVLTNEHEVAMNPRKFMEHRRYARQQF